MALRRRVAHRKQIKHLEVTNIVSLESYQTIARFGKVIDASSSGLLIYVNRVDLVPKNLRQNLTIASIEGTRVTFNISEMALDLDGIVARTQLIGKGYFEVGIDYSMDAPEYWRECLVDLLPAFDEAE